MKFRPTVTIRVRKSRRFGFIFKFVFFMRWIGAIRSNEHAVVIAQNMLMRNLQMEIKRRDKWERIW